MRVVYIAQSLIPSRTANSIHVMNICACFADMGYDVTLLCPEYPTDMSNEEVFKFYGVGEKFEIKKLSFPKTKGKTVLFSLAIFRMLKRIKPDYVVGRFVNGCYLSTFLNIPTTFDTHGPIWENGKLSTYLFKSMIVRKSFRRLTFNSQALKDIYVDSGLLDKVDPGKLIVANNGAHVYNLENKAELGKQGGRLKVGYFGHLYPGRGVEVILELAEKFQQMDFYVFGGEDRDIAYWKNQLSLDNLYFQGFVPFAEVYKYRQACDILLAPYQKNVATAGGRGDQSRYMNPIKYLEYMSSRKAIIVSDLPSAREVLDKDSCVFVHYNDIDAWSNALTSLENNPDKRFALGANAYQKFLANYTWMARAKKLIDIENEN